MLQVAAIPALETNYIWLVRRANQALVIDPGAAEPVLDYLQAQHLELVAVLITHRHADHCAGVASLLARYPRLRIYAPRRCFPDAAPNVRPVAGGERLGELGCEFQVMALPGHTAEHVGFHYNKLLFCGDVLFSAGCGRVADARYADMYASLMKIRHLPDDTIIYCAHDYTAKNLEFAHAVEPDNSAITEYIALLKQSPRGRATLPTALGWERQINPFLRCAQPAVISAVQHLAASNNPEDIFRALREWKDHF